MRRPLLAMMLLLLVPLAQAGTADNPEITDPDDVADSAPFSSYDAIDVLKGWLESEGPESFVFAVQMAGPVENDAPPGSNQELRYTLKMTYKGIEVPTSAQLIEGSGLSGAEAEGDVLRFTVNRNVWADVKPGQLLEDIAIETTGWTGSGEVNEASDVAPDAPGTGLDYVIGTLAEAGMDYDNDGIDDHEEVAGTTDPANPDTDLDGLKDGDELAQGTDPNNPDTDGDGLLDGDELAVGSDPTKADTDADGLNDKEEVEQGTNPAVADSDGDGLNDGDEIAEGTDPTKADSDGDGIDDQDELDNALDPTDGTDGLADHDGDGVSTADELAAGTDPYVSNLENEGLTADGPGGLPWWLWLVIAGFVILVIVLIFWFAALARRGPVEEEDEIPEDEHEVIEMEEGEGGKYEPLVLDEAYLTEGLEPEQIQRARRLFEERERRYLDQAYPGRAREFDDELPDVAEDKKAIKKLEREQRLRQREQAKAANLAAKEAAREAKLQARFEKELAKRQAKE